MGESGKGRYFCGKEVIFKGIHLFLGDFWRKIEWDKCGFLRCGEGAYADKGVE